MSAPVLRLSDVSVAIHDAPILKDIALDIAEAEIMALTGESGSGKSMTALATAQLLPASATLKGEITLGATQLTDLTESQMCAVRGRDIGMIFQEPMTALNPVQTIGAQVTETIRIHAAMTPARAEERAREVLEKVGLPPARFALSRYPHELSGGQRQRVSIAMAIALRPKLLIADEPTTALDVTTQAQILDLLQTLVRQDGMALMMITHDLAVVSDIADRIAVMKSGEIVEEGPTRQLFARMQHPYTRALFEASRHRADLPEIVSRGPLLKLRNVSRDYALPRTRLFQPRGSSAP